MRGILLVGLICIVTAGFTQEKMGQRALGASFIYHYGLILPKNPQLNYLIQDPVSAYEIRLGIHPNPNKNWIDQYSVTEIGLAYYSGSLGNDKVLGRITSVYPYIDFGLKEWKNVQIHTSVGLGFARVSEHYHPIDNYANSLIGSKYNAHINLSLNLSYFISNFKVSGGLYYSHVSNGSTQHPNDGYNSINSTLGISYHFGKKKEYFKLKADYPKLDNEFNLIWNHAFREKSINDPHKYYISEITLKYAWGINSKQRIGLGLDLFYDESINRGNWNLDPQTDIDHRFYQGVCLSHDLIFNKFSFTTQVGTYTYYKSKPSSNLIYNRIGLHYKFSNLLLVNISLKTYFDQSEYIAFGLGYYFNKKKRI
ncbi:acyloxyacyl hydrolase [Marinifilum caeruleilacunae]|uniref:Acyloxyacyl hydrolase n=1 Tax=Marinifilum caeruleilacunae TaxID=2499076 RepID=A0ABX1WTQ2_9BACT|nr:acyloxyacyl hydrolase [Marinifilum caeruleilacunae]NOU59488.1 hypothetical protein [Marinifilum caeruleilacunae]